MNEDNYKARGVIAAIVAGGLVALALALFFSTPTDAAERILTNMISALTLALGIIVQFYFGSSSGNKMLVASQSALTEKLVNKATGTGSGLAGAAPTGSPGDPVSVTESAAPRAARAPSYDPGDAVDIPFPPDPPEDPNLTRFRKQMRAMDPAVSEERVMAAYRVMYPGA